MEIIPDQPDSLLARASQFLRKHQETIYDADADFYHCKLDPDLVRWLMNSRISYRYADREQITIHIIAFMDTHEITIYDRTNMDFMSPGSDFTSIYTSNPPTIHIFEKPEEFRAKLLSRAYPINADEDHIKSNVYESAEPINEDNGSIYDVILSDPIIEIMRNYPIAVVGAGEVGSWLMILLTMLGFENFTFYELENARLEEKHSGKMPYLLDDIGRRKSQLMLNRLYKTNPLTNVNYEGPLTSRNLESILGKEIIVQALDDREVMGILHRYAKEQRIDVILATDVGKGAQVDLFRYSKGSELFNGKVTSDELARDESAIIKLLGIENILLSVDYPTLLAFLNKRKGHFGYLPQDPTAAYISAATTSTIISSIIKNESINSTRLFLDPRKEISKNKIDNLLDRISELRRAGLLQRIKLLSDTGTTEP